MDNGTLEFRERVDVSTSLELTAMKLQAFIREYKATVIDQSQGTIYIRLGSLGFTRKWGNTAERQPIDISMAFETLRVGGTSNEKAKTLRQVSVCIVPHGRTPDNDTFAKRCVSLMRDLRAYLLGS